MCIPRVLLLIVQTFFAWGLQVLKSVPRRKACRVTIGLENHLPRDHIGDPILPCLSESHPTTLSFPLRKTDVIVQLESGRGGWVQEIEKHESWNTNISLRVVTDHSLRSVRSLQPTHVDNSRFPGLISNLLPALEAWDSAVESLWLGVGMAGGGVLSCKEHTDALNVHSLTAINTAQAPGKCFPPSLVLCPWNRRWDCLTASKAFGSWPCKRQSQTQLWTSGKMWAAKLLR